MKLRSGFHNVKEMLKRKIFHTFARSNRALPEKPSDRSSDERNLNKEYIDEKICILSVRQSTTIETSPTTKCRCSPCGEFQRFLQVFERDLLEKHNIKRGDFDLSFQ